MSHQLSLFPEKDLPEEKEFPPDGDLNALDEIFAAAQHLRNGRDYLELLQFIVRFPKYSPFNCFLLYIQNSKISYVATAGTWEKRFKRRPKLNARPLIILAPMSPVRFVYDIDDTEGEPVPAIFLKQEATTGVSAADAFEKTVHNCAYHGILVREIILGNQPRQSAIQLTEDIRKNYKDLNLDAKMTYLILLNKEHSIEDKYAALSHELARVLCGHSGTDDNAWWQDRQNLRPRVKEIESGSVAFLICRRKGMDLQAEKYVSDSLGNDEALPLMGFNSVLQATNYIENMGKSHWKKPKKQR